MTYRITTEAVHRALAAEDSPLHAKHYIAWWDISETSDEIVTACSCGFLFRLDGESVLKASKEIEHGKDETSTEAHAEAAAEASGVLMACVCLPGARTPSVYCHADRHPASVTSEQNDFPHELGQRSATEQAPPARQRAPRVTYSEED